MLCMNQPSAAIARQLLEISEVARMVTLSVSRIRQLEAEGTLRPAIRTTRGVRLYERADVEKFLNDVVSARQHRAVQRRVAVVSE
jgi:hypothetical protein